MSKSFRSTSLLALALIANFGCGTGEDYIPREPVSGTVSLDGKPLEKGVIRFMPEDPESPTTATSTIENGSFRIEADSGLVPGIYGVMISSTDRDAKEPLAEGEMPGDTPRPAKELIPAKYNTKSELKAEVKAGVDNVFEYPLSGK